MKASNYFERFASLGVVEEIAATGRVHALKQIKPLVKETAMLPRALHTKQNVFHSVPLPSVLDTAVHS